MNYTTANKLRTADKQYPYLKWVRTELALSRITVRKWLEWGDFDDQLFEAFHETRQVILPIPVCDWSFLVCLHEIGHINVRERRYNYLEEYRAEKWAIARGLKYGVYSSAYVSDAKRYVLNHVVTDLAQSSTVKIKPEVLSWVYSK